MKALWLISLLIIILGAVLHIVDAVQPTSIPFYIQTNYTGSRDLTVTAYNTTGCINVLYNQTFTNRFENGEAFVVIGEDTPQFQSNYNNHTFFQFYTGTELLNFTNATEIASLDTTCLGIRAGQGQIDNNDIDTTTIQRRVSSSCSAGNSIRVIAVDGTVTCETDDIGVGEISNSSLSNLINGTISSLGNTSYVNTGNLTTFLSLWYNHTLTTLNYIPNIYYNKSQVDDLIPSFLTYYFWDVNSTINVTYKTMNTTQNPTIMNHTTNNLVNGQPIVFRLNENTNLTGLSSGPLHLHTSATKTAGTKDIAILGKLSKYQLNGTIVLLATTDTSPILITNQLTNIDLFATLSQQTLNVTDRLLWQLNAVVTGAGTNPDVSITVGGVTQNGLDLPVTLSTLVITETDPIWTAYKPTVDLWLYNQTITANKSIYELYNTIWSADTTGGDISNASITVVINNSVSQIGNATYVRYAGGSGNINTDSNLTITNNISAGYVGINIAHLNNSLRIVPRVNTSTAASTGGSILLDNTANAGLGVSLYTNMGGSSLGRLVNIKVDNPLFTQAAMRIDYEGLSNTLELIHNVNDTTSLALSVVSSNINDSTIRITGYPISTGVLEIIHNNATYSDADSSAIAISLAGDGTAAQGIFLDATGASGTIGKLLNIKNAGLNRLTLVDALLTINTSVRLNITACSEALETDSTGNIVCGADATGAGTISNSSITTLLNETISQIGNTSFVTVGNLTSFRALWYNYTQPTIAAVQNFTNYWYAEQRFVNGVNMSHGGGNYTGNATCAIIYGATSSIYVC